MGKFERKLKRRERKEHERMIREGEEATKVRKEHENKMKTCLVFLTIISFNGASTTIILTTTQTIILPF